ncbi:hypothetical protein ONE63_005803 [Megalurothrips usitatus]|uniref:Uncharacterized protein n=1 Tax=Megalurothrips usitatus TaxID=439358 RepID=A0AAV7XWP7_9NEOP|nr:hypothetical protein ONE63_005803 [Megalurothrips usitatus]
MCISSCSLCLCYNDLQSHRSQSNAPAAAGPPAMASSTVARRRAEVCLKESSPPVTASDSSDSEGEKDLGLEDFEIIKTIGE